MYIELHLIRYTKLSKLYTRWRDSGTYVLLYLTFINIDKNLTDMIRTRGGSS